jgi:diguanylate cyclase (GGDEF)-like protein
MFSVLVAEQVAGRPWSDPHAIVGWPLVRLVAAGLVYGVVSAVVISIAVGLYSGAPLLNAFRSRAVVLVGVAVGNSVGAGLVIALGAWSTPTLVVVPPMLALAYLFYWVSLHAREESELWQRLDTASAAVASLDEREIIAQAEAHASMLVGAESARLLLSTDPLAAVTSADTATIRVRVDGRRETSAVVIPLDGPDGTLGRLVLSFDGRVHLKERERRVLGTLARAISASLERARLYAETRSLAERKAHEASHDGLTGLANRTLLHDRLEEAVAVGPTALLLIDLDHFKTINDRYGHQAGDVVLATAARAARSCLREADTLVRHGGEEFLAILPGITAEQLPAICERVRMMVEAAIAHTDRGEVRVTASVGAVGLDDAPDPSADTLVERADRALYSAKAQGRNRVVLG